MPARAYWKGHLRLSLVTIGVELYSAVAGVKGYEMHQIHAPTGKRIRYQKTAPGVGPVPSGEIVRGVEVGKDEYVIIEPSDLDAVKLESKRTIDLVQFVDACEIDPRYFEKPYYVVPAADDVAAEGYAVIREALSRSDKVGLGQMAVRGRDSIIALKPCGRGLLLETLRYEEELRRSEGVFSDVPDVKVDADMVALAEELIERKASRFEPTAFRSEYDKAFRELVNEKRATGRVSDVTDESLSGAGNVVDLMEALRRSVSREDGVAADRASAGRARKPGSGKRRSATPGRRARG